MTPDAIQHRRWRAWVSHVPAAAEANANQPHPGPSSQQPQHAQEITPQNVSAVSPTGDSDIAAALSENNHSCTPHPQTQMQWQPDHAIPETPRSVSVNSPTGDYEIPVPSSANEHSFTPHRAQRCQRPRRLKLTQSLQKSYHVATHFFLSLLKIAKNVSTTIIKC